MLVVIITVVIIKLVVISRALVVIIDCREKSVDRDRCRLIDSLIGAAIVDPPMIPRAKVFELLLGLRNACRHAVTLARTLLAETSRRSLTDITIASCLRLSAFWLYLAACLHELSLNGIKEQNCIQNTRTRLCTVR